MSKTSLVKIAFKLLALLPLRVSRAVGSAFGYCEWRLRDRNAKVTLDNVQTCFPHLDDPARHQFAQKSMIETGKLGFEIPLIWMRSVTWLESKVESVHHAHVLLEAIEKGKGTIVLAPHLGNWEVLNHYIHSHSPLMNLYQPPKQHYLNDIVVQSREAVGAKLVPTSIRGVTRILKHLKEGGTTGILPDQNPNSGAGAFAPFFGQTAYTMTLVHKLLSKTEATALMGCALRTPKGFSIHFLEVDPEIYNDDSVISATALNRSVEKCIQLAPEQYQWEYKRFKKKPTL